MNGKLLTGVVCASVTPMKEDGTLDEKGIRNLCRHLVDGGIDCLYPNGTNGESISLSAQERRTVSEINFSENAGKSTLYIQCGAATVAETYDHVRHARALGVDGAGIMTPVFFAIDDASMKKYYADILDEVQDLPIYVYNISPRTGSDINASLLGELMNKYQNLMGIKYSYPAAQRMLEYINCCKTRKASVLVGNDAMATYCVLSGGTGWVSGPSAVFVDRFVKLRKALDERDYDTAAVYQGRIVSTALRMSDIPEIPAIKYMLKQMGVIDCEACRAPLRALTSGEKGRLDELLAEYIKEK